MSYDPVSSSAPTQGYSSQSGSPPGYVASPPPPAPRKAGRASGNFFKRLGLAGAVAGIGGLFIIISFCLLPWSILGGGGVVNLQGQPVTEIQGVSQTGFLTAIQITVFQGESSFKGILFPHLWLVVVAAAAFVVIALLMGLGSVSPRVGIPAVIGMSAAALVIEVLFPVQLTSLNSSVAGLNSAFNTGNAYAPDFGFWLVLGVTLLILLGAIVGWLQTRRAAAAGRQSLASRRASPASGGFIKRLGMVGLVAAIGGLLIAFTFFVSTWTVFGSDTASSAFASETSAGGYTGLSTAVGLSRFLSYPGGALFAHLWLVLLGVIAFLVVALLMGLGRAAPRSGALSIMGIAALTLLVELSYLMQIGSMNSAEKLSSTDPADVFTVGLGFWLALVVTLVLLVIAAYGALQRQRTAA